MIKITILGCGSSLGVPVIGCSCQVCISNIPGNKRLRSSLLIEKEDKNLLIDFGYDIRTQLLGQNIKKIDSAILTHPHADHLACIDDLRPFKIIYGFSPVEIYTTQYCSDIFFQRFPYLKNAKFFNINIIEPYQKSTISDIDLQFFLQNHGKIDSLGFRIKNFAYANDILYFYPESEQYLHNLDILIIDCINIKSTMSHAGLDRVLEYKEKFQPKKIYLTNMSHAIDYLIIQNSLPNNVFPLYDGKIFII